MTITTAELLEALAAEYRPPAQPADTFTREQMEHALGCGKDVALRHIRTLVHAGRAVPMSLAFTDIAGRVTAKIAYRLIPAPKKRRP